MHPLIQPAASALTSHPRRWMAALGTLLLGTGVTAFGIAPLAPDAADLPVHMVRETVQAMPLPELALAPITLYRSDSTRREDTAASLLQRMGVDDDAAETFLRQDPQARELFRGRPGKLVSVETDRDHRLLRLGARWMDGSGERFQRLQLAPDAQGQWGATLSLDTPAVATRLAGGVIQSSLFAATDRARIPDAVASQLAEVFSGEIDFRRDLRVGDRFSVVYETLEADGVPLRTGRLLSAEFVNKGREHRVLWFAAPGGRGDYYGFDGQSTRRAFLASPLAFSRVTSGYGMRFHPIKGGRRPHLGVDFAAPTGTPVRATADGTVKFAGRKGGYGNFIEVQHRNGQSTAYAHLHRILVRQGQRVDQGDTIGQVGSTGASTGPHLHYEFREKGVAKDPLKVARIQAGEPVPASARAPFQQAAGAMRLQLDAATTSTLASAE